MALPATSVKSQNKSQEQHRANRGEGFVLG